MKEILMDAGIIAGAVLAVVGLFKLPFKKFKTNHPKTFKFVFYFLSIILSVGLSVLAQLYIVCANLWSTDFVMLVISTVAFVFGGYGTYESTSLKVLVKKIALSFKAIGIRHSESKVVKKLEKLVNQVGRGRIEEIMDEIPDKQ